MSTINMRRCLVAGANTGPSACDFDLGRVVGVLAVPKRTSISQANFAQDAFNTLMGAATTNDSRAMRWYPINGLIAYTPAIGDLQREDLPYISGSKTTRRGNIDMTFRVDANIDRAQRLNRLLHGSQGRFDFFFVMEVVGGGYAVFGTQTATVAGVPTLNAISMRDVAMLSTQLATDSATTMHQLMFSFANPNVLNENMGFIFLDANPMDTNPGLIDIYLTARTGTVTGHFFLRPVGGTVPLTDLFATPLLTLSNYGLRNKLTGATVTPTAAAISGDEIDITTGATTGTVLVVTMAATSVLSTNLIPGYESNTVEVAVA